MNKKKLWRVFSEYIRLRDSSNGYGQCISCGKLVAYPNKTGAWHAGHYYPRSTTWNSLYFDEQNVNGQCSHCNTFLEGNKQGYALGLTRKYGEKILDRLAVKKGISQRKMYPQEYELLVEHYKGKIKGLKKERGIA